MLEGEAMPEELLHALLGAGASNTLEGGLVQAHVFAELLEAHLATDRHFGTLARHLARQLEVCLVLVEALDLDAHANEEVKTK